MTSDDPNTASILATFEGRDTVVFDLDGTLHGGGRDADPAGDSARVTGLRVRHLVGVDDPFGAFAAFDRKVRAARPGISKPAALSAWYGIGLAEMNRFRETHETPEAHVRPHPGIDAALDVFGSRFRLVLATNNSPRLARRILRSLGIAEDRFAVVVAAEDAGAPKPAAAFFAHVVKAAGTSYDRCVSVGDGLVTDIEPARALGFATYHVRGPRDVVHAARVLRGMLQ